MSDIPFQRTRMGQIFLEVTVPALVREIARLNTNLERLVVAAEGKVAVDGERAAAEDDRPP